MTTVVRRLLAASLGAALGIALARSAAAQCGAAPSSCRQCHELEGTARRPPPAPWHADHALGDFCADCHGGDATVRDEARAHVTLVDPLSSSGSRCTGCHEDALERATAYSAARASRPDPPGGNGIVDDQQPGRGDGESNFANRLLALVVAGVGAAGGLAIARTEARRRQGPVHTRPLSVRAKEWSPYVAGALLGVLTAAAMGLFGHRLSGGGAYQQLARPLGVWLLPRSVYFTRVLAPGGMWELAGLAGALLGAFSSARLSRSFAWRIMPDTGWERTFGSSRVKRWLIGFGGAALTQFAAGIAGGCTASLAVSGGAALAPGAFAFMAGMFAGGIPTAWLLHRRKGP